MADMTNTAPRDDSFSDGYRYGPAGERRVRTQPAMSVVPSTRMKTSRERLRAQLAAHVNANRLGAR